MRVVFARSSGVGPSRKRRKRDMRLLWRAVLGGWKSSTFGEGRKAADLRPRRRSTCHEAGQGVRAEGSESRRPVPPTCASSSTLRCSEVIEHLEFPGRGDS